MNINTQKITGLLHQLRTPSSGLTEAHLLAELLHEANSDDCKLALLEFCKGLLIGHRNITELQIATAERESRNDGELH